MTEPNEKKPDATPLDVLKALVAKIESGELKPMSFVMVWHQPRHEAEGGGVNTSITSIGMDWKEQVICAQVLNQFAMDRITGRPLRSDQEKQL